jgi:hypothetical protein
MDVSSGIMIYEPPWNDIVQGFARTTQCSASEYSCLNLEQEILKHPMTQSECILPYSGQRVSKPSQLCPSRLLDGYANVLQIPQPRQGSLQIGQVHYLL